MTQTAPRPEAGAVENQESQRAKGAEEIGKSLLRDTNMDTFKNIQEFGKMDQSVIQSMGLASADQLLGNGNGVGDKQLNPKPGGSNDSLTPGEGSRSQRDAFPEERQKQIQDQVKREMSPTEKEQYSKEEAALKDYEAQYRRWAMGTGGGAPPERPSTPMHGTVEQRSQERQQQIAEQARQEYGPVGQSELGRQMREHDRKTEEFYKSRNPAGTGDWRKPPEPPPMVREYYDKVRRITDSKN